MSRDDALGGSPATLPFVCLAVGEAYADPYIARLHAMLSRHCARPFRLFCYSDRARSVPPGVELLSCADWNEVTRAGMRPTTRKLRFFDGETVPFAEFWYLDLTLVIRRDMTDLLTYGAAQIEDLVIVRDWSYLSYNSCVMRVRRGPLRAIYDAFVNGETYPFRIAGDQDFLSACVAAKGLESRVAEFRVADIASYKELRFLNRRDMGAAARAIEAATIVKFHGKPKPHQVLDPLFNFFKIRLKSRRDADFFRAELRREWQTPIADLQAPKEPVLR